MDKPYKTLKLIRALFGIRLITIYTSLTNTIHISCPQINCHFIPKFKRYLAKYGFCFYNFAMQESHILITRIRVIKDIGGNHFLVTATYNCYGIMGWPLISIRSVTCPGRYFFGDCGYTQLFFIGLCTAVPPTQYTSSSYLANFKDHPLLCNLNVRKNLLK